MLIVTRITMFAAMTAAAVAAAAVAAAAVPVTGSASAVKKPAE